MSNFSEAENIDIFYYIIFFSEPISIQTYNYTETSILIYKVLPWNGFYVNVSLDWDELRYVVVS